MHPGAVRPATDRPIENYRSVPRDAAANACLEALERTVVAMRR